MLEKYEGLIRFLAKRVTRNKSKFDDLCQVGRLTVHELEKSGETDHDTYVSKIFNAMLKYGWNDRNLRISKSTYYRIKARDRSFRLKAVPLEDLVEDRPSGIDHLIFWDTVVSVLKNDKKKILVVRMFLLGFKPLEIGQMVGMTKLEVINLCTNVARIFKYE